jgi:hypothetical protein
VKTGVQGIYMPLEILDSGFRRNDGRTKINIFNEIINLWELKLSERR